jgi:nitrite reductase/ring-hydroxylating ferredoxin subunit/uncharacterized membrane protein
MLWTTLTGRLEQARSLDPAVEAVSGVANAVLRPGVVKDGLHGRWLGHPLHPLLIALPIGLWSGASLLDLRGGEAARSAAQRLVGAGVLAVAPTAAAGWADWSELGTSMRPKRVGLVHAAANLATTGTYLASWLARRRGDHGRGRALALAGAGGLMVGGYLGGHLSYSNGVGVNRNADEDVAPTTWTDVASVDAVAADGLHRFDVEGQQVVVVSEGDQLFAMGATCSHLGGPLEEGSLQDGCLVCPWHQSAFRLHDGSVARGPATSPQRSYELRRRGGRVEVRVRP